MRTPTLSFNQFIRGVNVTMGLTLPPSGLMSHFVLIGLRYSSKRGLPEESRKIPRWDHESLPCTEKSLVDPVISETSFLVLSVGDVEIVKSFPDQPCCVVWRGWWWAWLWYVPGKWRWGYWGQRGSMPCSKNLLQIIDIYLLSGCLNVILTRWMSSKGRMVITEQQGSKAQQRSQWHRRKIR